MTPIIGYTRVPFNTLSSNHLTIAPVKQIYPIKKPSDQETQQSTPISNKFNDPKAKKPLYHRIFSREMKRDGIIELIIDRKQMTNRTIGTPDSRIVHQPRRTKKSIRYNVLLSMDLIGEYSYDTISELNGASSDDDMQRLIDSLSKSSHEKLSHFRNILSLLKKLQTQKSYQFMVCTDRCHKKISLYFPDTISASVEQTYMWLKYTIGIDVNIYKNWELSPVIKRNQLTDAFDGERYFKEIQMFINHVDLLIESNGLFFHHQIKNQL
ncbi:uncharacterized protein EV154DRAFT_527953, partial [Mucor mucedo]|uniref:uncharacterized protein n=1 Tax=Mucor mucedo TaxID=29922 RepID=UPI002220363F